MRWSSPALLDLTMPKLQALAAVLGLQKSPDRATLIRDLATAYSAISGMRASAEAKGAGHEVRLAGFAGNPKGVLLGKVMRGWGTRVSHSATCYRHEKCKTKAHNVATLPYASYLEEWVAVGAYAATAGDHQKVSRLLAPPR